MKNLDALDLVALRNAKLLLENPGLAVRLVDLVGSPLERGMKLLPEKWHGRITGLAEGALESALRAATRTMSDVPGMPPSNRLHKTSAVVAGGIGGWFGLPALVVELPVSTTIMMRSIADIARSEGESIDAASTQFACVEVFALGGPSAADDAADAGYFAVRAGLAQTIAEASRTAGRATARDGATLLAKLIARVAQRFGVQLSEKAAAQAIPALGAAGGAAVNALFIEHFQRMARGHFVVRRLEHLYGREATRLAYDRL